MKQIVLVIHNVRSAHNVGSMLRTADGLGVSEVYLTGYSPYPALKSDNRLPHQAAKVDRAIKKTSLGAEKMIKWHAADIDGCLKNLKTIGYRIVGLEQTKIAVDIGNFKSTPKTALIVGNEIGGLDKKILNSCDAQIKIPMRGQKESFNVSVAAAIALYHLQSQTD